MGFEAVRGPYCPAGAKDHNPVDSWACCLRKPMVDSAKPKEPQWTMRTHAVDPRQRITSSSAAPTTGHRPRNMLYDAGAMKRHLPACAQPGFFTLAPPAAGHARGRSRSVLAALADPQRFGALYERSGCFSVSELIVMLNQRLRT